MALLYRSYLSHRGDPIVLAGFVGLNRATLVSLSCLTFFGFLGRTSGLRALSSSLRVGATGAAGAAGAAEEDEDGNNVIGLVRYSSGLEAAGVDVAGLGAAGLRVIGMSVAAPVRLSFLYTLRLGPLPSIANLSLNSSRNFLYCPRSPCWSMSSSNPSMSLRFDMTSPRESPALGMSRRSSVAYSRSVSLCRSFSP